MLFCNVHWVQLPPKYQAPIVLNQEAPRYATLDDARKVINGTGAAVDYLAGKEGRKAALSEAKAVAASSPVTGTTDQVDTSGSSGVARVVSEPTGSGTRRLSDTSSNL